MNMKKRIALILAFILCFALLTACGGETEEKAGHITHLGASSSVIAEGVRANGNFSGAAFINSSDEDADLTLMFDYCVEDDAMIEAIEDYTLSTITGNADPRIFSVIRCKDGTAPETITAIGEAMKNYADYVIAQMVRYNGEMVALAQAYTVTEYDNGVILTIFDEQGNDAILSLVDTVGK